MSATIEIKEKSYQINIPIIEAYENRVIKEFINYLRIRDISSRSKATDEQIKELSDEVTRDYWENHKRELLD